MEFYLCDKNNSKMMVMKNSLQGNSLITKGCTNVLNCLFYRSLLDDNFIQLLSHFFLILHHFIFIYVFNIGNVVVCVCVQCAPYSVVVY